MWGRLALGNAACASCPRPCADYFVLRRFLRARTYDLARAKDMWLAHVKWVAENGVEGVMHDFTFGEEAEVLRFYPQGYHKMDKTVRGLPRPMGRVPCMHRTAIREALGGRFGAFRKKGTIHGGGDNMRARAWAVHAGPARVGAADGRPGCVRGVQAHNGGPPLQVSEQPAGSTAATQHGMHSAAQRGEAQRHALLEACHIMPVPGPHRPWFWYMRTCPPLHPL